MEIDDFTNYRYLFGKIINNKPQVIAASDNFDVLFKLFDEYRANCEFFPSEQHIEYYIYDYEKDCNVEYYDNQSN